MFDALLAQPGVRRLRSLYRRHANPSGAALAAAIAAAAAAVLYALGDMSELAERRAAAEPAAFSQAYALATDDAAAAGAGVLSGVLDDGWLFLRREAAPELAARVPDLAADIVSRLFVEAVVPLSDAGPRASLASVLGGLFSLALVAIMGRYMMTMTGLGRSIGEALYVDEIETRFADVAGAAEAVRDLGELARMIRGELSYGALGARTPKGVLLVGPPGTGKTLLARATAGEARVNFIACAGSDFGGMLVGQGARDVGQLVARARRMAPCIVFIDEIDAVGKARGKVSHTDYETTLTKLLAEMDGVTAAGGVYFLAATNHAAALDPALVRPGRFDRVIRVPLPDLAARKKLLALHARGLALAPDAELGDIARLAHGFSGAQLAALANEAAIQAGRAGASAVAREHFERALMKLSIGERVEGAPLAPADRRLVAYHEAGHALLALSDPAAPPVDRVTIVPHGEALGHVATRPPEDVRVMAEAALRSRLRCLAGGRAGEIVGCGEGARSTLAAADVAEVSRLALEMAGRWAMAEPEEFFAAPEPGPLEGPAEATLARARAIAAQALREAVARLGERAAALHAMAAALEARETLSGEEALAIVADAEAHGAVAPPPTRAAS
ncbi:AAA family ATPase [Rubrimonas cliftonensis]|uniref:Cell division protease FtsH n=1 Tax=Rubrimonas cliftonensis TaxID=89524 RepID=A0A1H4FWD8_9RHOB|nr:AAA family ATPase [Rubrimonas cliftonensis]SEB00948.1 cell division protease FtsH [Rubrimonas cliftonensis]